MENIDPSTEDAGPPDIETKYKRSLADLENLRKRMNREVSEARDQAEAGAIQEFLPIIDDFQRALQSLEVFSDATKEQVLDGFRLVFRKFRQVLDHLEVQGFDAVGKRFTADIMEAIAQVPERSLPAGTVVNQIEQGFTRRGKLLRPAKVAVACMPEDGDAPDR